MLALMGSQSVLQKKERLHEVAYRVYLALSSVSDQVGTQTETHT